MKTKAEITGLLLELREGSNAAYEQLFPLVYDELHRLAQAKLKKEHDRITLTETALVHEVYLKMIDQSRIKANDKNHFLAIAARCMRQILVDHARKRKAQKRGGDQKDLTYVDELFGVEREADELVNFDDKLNQLEQLDERMAQVVTLRFFGQMSIPAVANALDVSESTIKRDWVKARGWLYQELKNKT